MQNYIIEINNLKNKKKNTLLYNYLYNKSVILVGPDTNLLEQNYGEFIDNHDVVIRMKEAIYIYSSNDYINYTNYIPNNLKKYNNDYTELKNKIGYKTNILYNIYSDKNYKNDNIDFIINYNNSPENYNIKPIQLSYDDNNRTVLDDIYKYYKYEHLENKGYSPSTGLLTLFDILLYDIKNLSIRGMTFYEKGHKIFNNSYNFTGHDSRKELKTLSFLMEINKNIIFDIDSILSELLYNNSFT